MISKEQLIFIEKIEEGLLQANAGEVVSNEEVKNMIERFKKSKKSK